MESADCRPVGDRGPFELRTEVDGEEDAMELRCAAVRGSMGPAVLVLAVMAALWGGFPSAQQAPAGQGINERFRSTDLDTAAVAARFESADREAFARRHDVIAALGLRPGMAVVDVGAGSGFYAALMAAAVGPTGSVYAVEIAPNWVEFLTERFVAGGLDNVRVVRGTGQSVELPAASVDLVFSSDTYHHFEDPPVILGSIQRALKAGGRWAVLDYDRIPGVTPPARMAHLRVGKAEAVEEILSAGFRLEREVDLDLAESYLAIFQRSPESGSARARGGMWFEGARLIDGSGGAPVERSAFLVEDGVFTWVGRQDEQEPPAGGTRVDLAGKTVIPALIDAHQHIGLTNVKDGTHRKDNYTRANLVEHLERSAYHGVAATMSLGLEADEGLAFELREEAVPKRARFLTSGRGIAATPTAGPQQEYRIGIPRGAQTEAEGRAAVEELDGHGVELVKIWVDDRGGTVPKLEPEVYRAIIDEAHARGMRVTSHLGSTSGLADAKDLLRAGVDGFAHTVRDRDIDAEYMALVREHPDVWTVPNLPGSPVTLDDLSWLGETLPPFEIENLCAQAERLAAEGPSASFELQCRNLARNREAGMIIGMGTDSGVSVGWTTHTELRDMAGCGLSPMDVIVAATRVNADILGLDGLGMVTPGRSASFVVLDANPLEKIAHTRRIVDVYLQGERVDRDVLRARFMAGVP